MTPNTSVHDSHSTVTNPAKVVRISEGWPWLRAVREALERCPELSAPAVGIYRYLAERCHRGGRWADSQKAIAEGARVSRRTVQRHVAVLHRVGLLEYVLKGGSRGVKRGLATEYRLTPHAFLLRRPGVRGAPGDCADQASEMRQGAPTRRQSVAPPVPICISTGPQGTEEIHREEGLDGVPAPEAPPETEACAPSAPSRAVDRPTLAAAEPREGGRVSSTSAYHMATGWLSGDADAALLGLGSLACPVADTCRDELRKALAAKHTAAKAEAAHTRAANAVKVLIQAVAILAPFTGRLEVLLAAAVGADGNAIAYDALGAYESDILHPGLHDAALICVEAVGRWADRTDLEREYDACVAAARDLAGVDTLSPSGAWSCTACGARHREWRTRCASCRVRYKIEYLQSQGVLDV